MKNIVQLISNEPRLQNFHSALVQCGLDQTLQWAGPFDVFVPLNISPFVGLSDDSLKAEILRHVCLDSTRLPRDLLNEVVGGPVKASNGNLYFIRHPIRRNRRFHESGPYSFIEDYLREETGCNYVETKCRRERKVKCNPCCQKEVKFGSRLECPSSSSSSRRCSSRSSDSSSSCKRYSSSSSSRSCSPRRRSRSPCKRRSRSPCKRYSSDSSSTRRHCDSSSTRRHCDSSSTRRHCDSSSTRRHCDSSSTRRHSPRRH